MRASWVAVALLATAGAAPLSHLPVPPIPPARPPAAFLAPVPNPDAQAPNPTTPLSPRVTVEDFRVNRPNPAFGYSPGSQYETSEEKRPIQTPGVAVQLPLH
jgi:hypothetical protein